MVSSVSIILFKALNIYKSFNKPVPLYYIILFFTTLLDAPFQSTHYLSLGFKLSLFLPH